MTQLTYDQETAALALSEADPALASVIERVGKPEVGIRPPDSVFEALLRAIVFQQLTGRAAETILSRVLESISPSASPHALLAASDETLRAAGLSRAKLAAARDLAEKVLDGTLPTTAELGSMTDAEISERLTVVRGVGPWSVQMVLLFRLGRPDVWPSSDLGIRKGLARMKGLSVLPDPATVELEGERWKPWRSLAAWYLWRILELPK